MWLSSFEQCTDSMPTRCVTFLVLLWQSKFLFPTHNVLCGKRSASIALLLPKVWRGNRVAANSGENYTLLVTFISCGGFSKDSSYCNFDLRPILSNFSSRDTECRNNRVKAVFPLLTDAAKISIPPDRVIRIYNTKFVTQIHKLSIRQLKKDIFDLCAHRPIDDATACLLAQRYGRLIAKSRQSIQ